jgi:hypothetical protein
VSEPLDDVWYSRELPVLREAVRGINAGLNGVPVRTIAEATGLNADDVVLSLHALEAVGLVEMRWVMPAAHGRVWRVSGDAQRATGAWPTPEAALDRMIAALDAIAASTDDEDTRTRVAKIKDALLAGGKQIGLAVATTVITGVVPH